MVCMGVLIVSKKWTSQAVLPYEEVTKKVEEHQTGEILLYGKYSGTVLLIPLKILLKQLITFRTFRFLENSVTFNNMSLIPCSILHH